jgi:hypothetical protein
LPSQLRGEGLHEAGHSARKASVTSRVVPVCLQAEKIKALARIDISELEQRALTRLLTEEAKRQSNIESIVCKALPGVKDDARPEDVEADWMATFFDKSRLVSDDEMQSLWARVLAGEANEPGQYSKRTVNILSSLDKREAQLFSLVCRFVWCMPYITPLIFDASDDIYRTNGLTFSALQHLDDIGLLSYEHMAGFNQSGLPKVLRVVYYGTPVWIQFNKNADNLLNLGGVMLTRAGEELAPISGAEPVTDFLEYVLEHWMFEKAIPFSEWPSPLLRLTRALPALEPYATRALETFLWIHAAVADEC